VFKNQVPRETLGYKKYKKERNCDITKGEVMRFMETASAIMIVNVGGYDRLGM
jgi:hypothetical protein